MANIEIGDNLAIAFTLASLFFAVAWSSRNK